MIKLMLYSLDSSAITVCLFSAFLLLMQPEANRSRKVLGSILLVWAAIYIASLFKISSFDSATERGYLPMYELLIGVLGSMSFLFYLFEMLRSGWLNRLRVLLLTSPLLFGIALLSVGQLISDTPIRTLQGFSDLVTHIGEFNVWFRLFFLLLTCFYVASMYLLFIQYAPRYRRWTEENYSSTELADISWLYPVLLGITGISTIFAFGVFDGSFTTVIIHLAFIILFFPYLTFKALAHKNPYPENYFKASLHETQIEAATEHENSHTKEEYRQRFDEWMRSSKPYLHTDFSLTDVNLLLPMTPPYHSKLFHELYGCSFSRLIRQYRVEESMLLMEIHPEMTAKELALLCGFSSHVIFHRAFSEITGTTPMQYKKSKQA